MCAFSDRTQRLRSIQKQDKLRPASQSCISVGEIKLLAEQRHAGDGEQRPLVPRSRSSPRLKPSVGQRLYYLDCVLLVVWSDLDV